MLRVLMRQIVCLGLVLGLMSAGQATAGDAQGTSGSSKDVPPKLGDVFVEPLLNMEMVYIEPGSFTMGSPEDEPGRFDDERQHQVQIDHGFWIGRYEVTFAQYDAFYSQAKTSGTFDQGWGRGNRPVINVNWFNAVEFARWLSKKTGRHYRLPTEAEWEYAARAGTTTAFSFGNDPAAFADYAWCSLNSGRQTHPVGEKKPNPWGLYDIHGNVWEWTASVYVEDYDGSELRDSSDNPSNDLRVARGGSWFFLPKALRSADRRAFSPRYRTSSIGFRLVRDE